MFENSLWRIRANRCKLAAMPAFAKICLLTLVFAPFARADERIDGLSQDALQQAVRILKRDYIRPEALSYEELNKAAFEGLLRRLAFGAQLVNANADEEPQDGKIEFFSELITPKTGYIRLASFHEDEIAHLDEALLAFDEAEAETLVLDLRVPAPTARFDAAARILDRFVPTNTLLFKIQKPGQTRPELFFSQVSSTRWRGSRLLLLTDSETPNAGEIIAAVIDANRQCFVVGGPTKGLTVQYQQIPLDETTLLRFAVAEVVLADDTSLFQTGVQPDFAVAEDLESKHKVFAASQAGPLQRYLFEQARPRINEAALVHATDPELDYHLARARGEITQFDRVPLQDRTLQRALDLLTALRHFAEKAATEAAAAAENAEN